MFWFCANHFLFGFQVLFVPRHWWHYVESIDPVTVSINSWIELVFSFSNKCHLLAFKIHNACLFNLMTNFNQHFRVTLSALCSVGGW